MKIFGATRAAPPPPGARQTMKVIGGVTAVVAPRPGPRHYCTTFRAEERRIDPADPKSGGTQKPSSERTTPWERPPPSGRRPGRYSQIWQRGNRGLRPCRQTLSADSSENAARTSGLSTNCTASRRRVGVGDPRSRQHITDTERDPAPSTSTPTSGRADPGRAFGTR